MSGLLTWLDNRFTAFYCLVLTRFHFMGQAKPQHPLLKLVAVVIAIYPDESGRAG
jgi:hypothetical protein